MSICLAMIVKNEARNIVDTLDSALPHVSRVCIVDTGSTDGTQALIQERLQTWLQVTKGAAYSLGQRPWVDFSHNRNECLDIARAMCADEDWLLMMSGDSLLVRDPRLGPLAPVVEQEAEAGGHTAFAIETTLGTLEYPTVRLFRASSDWRYRGKVHEVPISASGKAYGKLSPESVRVKFLGTDRHEKRAQWESHLPLLMSQMAEEDGRNPRTVFYLAQTFACLGRYVEAAQYYRLRIALPGGWEPERWEAKLRLAQLSSVLSAEERRFLLLKCTEDAPQRAEPWYYLAELSRDEGDWQRAYSNARIAAQCAAGERAGLLFVRKEIYDFRAQLLWGTCAMNTGRENEADAIFDGLLKGGRLDAGHTALVRTYLGMLRKLGIYAKV